MVVPPLDLDRLSESVDLVTGNGDETYLWRSVRSI